MTYWSVAVGGLAGDAGDAGSHFSAGATTMMLNWCHSFGRAAIKWPISLADLARGPFPGLGKIRPTPGR